MRKGGQKTAGRKLLAGIIEYYAIKICISASALLRGTFNQKIHQEIASGQFLFSSVASRRLRLSRNSLLFALGKFATGDHWNRRVAF